jgi:hypothetical protein
MKCEKCRESTHVVNVRDRHSPFTCSTKANYATRGLDVDLKARKRKCKKCGYIFYTVEISTEDLKKLRGK